MKKSTRAKIASALAALAVSTGGLTVLAASPAQAAANPPCMSRPEYRQVKVGMTLTRVAGIVGSRGKNSMQSSMLSIRQWKTCGNAFGVATLGFMYGKVDNKSFIG